MKISFSINTCIAILLVSPQFGCTHQSRTEQLGWDEIITSVALTQVPNEHVLAALRDSEPLSKNDLPKSISTNSELSELVLNRSLSRPRLYEGGVLGRVGNAKMFVALRERIPNYNRLYWVMIKTLSEKYGCFMTGRVRKDNLDLISCRDSRKIGLWRSQGKNWIQFSARQFDNDGYEIAVRRRKIVRISKDRMIL